MADNNQTNVAEATEEVTRERANTSDKNTLLLLKNIVRAYHEIGLLSNGERAEVDSMDGIEAINQFLSRKIRRLTTEQKLRFSEAFVGDDLTNFNGATPAILAYAYRAAYAKAQQDEGQKERLQKIAAHIDGMSADFANSGGMLINSTLVDTTNAADVYPGFADMLNARMGDIDKIEGEDRDEKIADKQRQMADLGVAVDEDKAEEFRNNLGQLESAIAEYDDMWGLTDITPDNAAKLEERWDALMDAVSRSEITEETKANASKYKFTQDGRVIPQFVSRNRRDKTEYEEYEPGRTIVKDGRLATIIELARHDVARRHVGKIDEELDEDALEQEVNDEVLFKLYNMSVADRMVTESMDDPEVFMDPANRDEIIQNLAQNGGEISDRAYNATLDAQVNSTAGWASRIKTKVGNATSKVGGFFGKVFNSVKRVDRLSGARMAAGPVDKREKRIEFFKRILKGFASAFVASALITTIATAAAATAGISLAAGLAIVGFITALGMGLVQFHRWKKAQQAAGQPTDLKTMLKDTRLITSLGVSAIAVIAMAFGAAGLGQAAMALGYGALALGGTKNAVEMYRDARGANLSVVESIAWAIANAGAVIGGGFAGRAAAHAGINWFNKTHPENEIFQERGSHMEQRPVHDTRDVTETKLEYTQEALDNAEGIVKTWYQDNPDLLQARVDAINAYNAEHGTTIDPYRAIMASADAGAPTYDNMRLHVDYSHTDPNIHDVYSHGHHRIMTPRWGDTYGFSKAELDAAAHLFQGDSAVLNPDAMDVVGRLDHFMSDTNTIGPVTGRPVQHDGYFPPNDPEGWTSYTDGNSAFIENTYTHQEPYTYFEDVPVPDHTPVNAGGMAAFGNYNPRERFTQLRERVGSFFDKIRKRRHEHDPVPVIDDDDQKLLGPGHKDDQHLLGPGHKDDDQHLLGPGHKDDDQHLLNPGHKDDDQHLLGPGRDDRLLIEPVLDEDRELVLGVDRAQAHNWINWHEQLKVVNEELAKSPKSREAAKLQRQRKTLQQNIAHLRNQLGHASDEEIDRGVEFALKREEMQKCIDELATLRANKPNQNNTPKYEMAEWESKQQRLVERFKELNKDLSKYDVYYRAPVQGVQARKQAERDANIEDAEIIEEVEPIVEPQDELVIEDVEPVSEPQDEAIIEEAKPVEEAKAESGNTDEVVQDIDWSKYQSPFVFEHDKIEAERPDDLRDKFNLSDNTVRGIDIASMLKKPEPDKNQEQQVVPEKPKPKKINNLHTAVEEAYGKLIRGQEGRHYFVPQALEKLAEEGHITEEPIGTYKGIEIRLVDLNNNGNPIVNSEDGPVVMIDLNGIKIPFVLSTGMNPDVPVAPGKWYPVSNVQANGRFYNPSHKMEQERYEMELEDGEDHVAEYGRLMEIAELLNAVIGDVRNWEDIERTKQYSAKGGKGSIGGCDVVPTADAAEIVDTLGRNEYYCSWDGVQRLVYSPLPDSTARDRAVVYRALNEMETPEWHEENYNVFGKLKKGAQRVKKYARKMIDSAEQSFMNLFGLQGRGHE